MSKTPNEKRIGRLIMAISCKYNENMPELMTMEPCIEFSRTKSIRGKETMRGKVDDIVGETFRFFLSIWGFGSPLVYTHSWSLPFREMSCINQHAYQIQDQHGGVAVDSPHVQLRWNSILREIMNCWGGQNTC